LLVSPHNISLGTTMTLNKNEERGKNPPMTKLANGIAVKERAPQSGVSSEAPIVLLHGSGFDSSVFDAQFNSHILAHHHLIAMDLPGHGQSDNARNPQADYSYAAMGEKVLEALNLMGVQSAIFVGWSLGGQIAIEINHDDCVKGVFAFGVAPIAPGPMGMIKGFHFSRDLLLASKAQFTHADAKRFEIACLGNEADGQCVDALIRVDPALRPAISKMALKGLGLDQKSAVEVVVLDDCGHAPFMDAPESFDLILSDFAEWVEINAFAFDRALMDERNAA